MRVRVNNRLKTKQNTTNHFCLENNFVNFQAKGDLFLRKLEGRGKNCTKTGMDLETVIT